jgi:hypothetical protein
MESRNPSNIMRVGPVGTAMPCITSDVSAQRTVEDEMVAGQSDTLALCTQASIGSTGVLAVDWTPDGCYETICHGRRSGSAGVEHLGQGL